MPSRLTIYFLPPTPPPDARQQPKSILHPLYCRRESSQNVAPGDVYPSSTDELVRSSNVLPGFGAGHNCPANAESVAVREKGHGKYIDLVVVNQYVADLHWTSRSDTLTRCDSQSSLNPAALFQPNPGKLKYGTISQARSGRLSHCAEATHQMHH